MLIAVISDSHGNRISIDKVKKRISSADVLLFLGDGEGDLREITEEFKGEVYAVRGNCDMRGLYPEERLIELQGKKIFMCHGHRYGVKYGYNSILLQRKRSWSRYSFIWTFSYTYYRRRGWINFDESRKYFIRNGKVR